MESSIARGAKEFSAVVWCAHRQPLGGGGGWQEVLKGGEGVWVACDCACVCAILYHEVDGAAVLVNELGHLGDG